jgi:selenocysteine-specific elongation factor
MRVIGTAGHVDHGKSTLVQAITGIHPDRLKEEQEREMTIDLGFAWFTLPDGEEVGIVDVPGHRDFIENMLAGIGGIDAAVLVIAADEGIMPQTREHLAILDLLSIHGGVIALSKVDLISEPEWLDLVEEEIRQVTQGTVLADAPIIRVSARTGYGLDELIAAIAVVLSEQPARIDVGRPRLPVDRVFTITGFGTVVTGTLMDGKLQVGDEIEVLPSGKRGRIRGIQSHKRKSSIALPGSRTAANLSGLDHTDLQRGNVIGHPGDFRLTRRIDARIRVLPDVDFSLKHNSQVKLFIGAAEVMARVRLLGTELIEPGHTGWLQIEPVDAIVCTRGDRFILRRPSPADTIGGGIVVDAHPKRRHKRHDEQVIRRLEALAEGDPADVLEQTLLAAGIAPLKTIYLNSKLETDPAQKAVSKLIAENRMLILEGSSNLDLHSEQYVTSPAYMDQVALRAEQILQDFHKATPLRIGMPREEYKSKLKLPARQYNLVLKYLLEMQAVEEAGGYIQLPGHQIRFSPQQKQSIERLFSAFRQDPYNPPSVKDAEKMAGADVYRALLETGQLIQVSAEVVYLPETYRELRDKIIQLIKKQGEVTVAQVRDLLDTSRKFALALLEHLDAGGVTIRQGDFRRLK